MYFNFTQGKALFGSLVFAILAMVIIGILLIDPGQDNDVVLGSILIAAGLILTIVVVSICGKKLFSPLGLSFGRRRKKKCRRGRKC